MPTQAEVDAAARAAMGAEYDADTYPFDQASQGERDCYTTIATAALAAAEAVRLREYEAHTLSAPTDLRMETRGYDPSDPSLPPAKYNPVTGRCDCDVCTRGRAVLG